MRNQIPCQLIRDAARHPNRAVGKPKPLRHEFQGYWSRRIDREYRLVYKPTKVGLLIAQLRYHD